jgi:hypothetical protein
MSYYHILDQFLIYGTKRPNLKIRGLILQNSEDRGIKNKIKLKRNWTMLFKHTKI